MKTASFFDRVLTCMIAMIVFCLGSLFLGCESPDVIQSNSEAEDVTAPKVPDVSKYIDPTEPGMIVKEQECLLTGFKYTLHQYTIHHPLGLSKIRAALTDQTNKTMIDVHLFSEGFTVRWQESKYTVTESADGDTIRVVTVVFEQEAAAGERSRAVLFDMIDGTDASIKKIEKVYQGAGWIDYWSWPFPTGSEMDQIGYDEQDRPTFSLSIPGEIRYYTNRQRNAPVVDPTLDPDFIDYAQWIACVSKYGSASCGAAFIICDLFGDPWSSCVRDGCFGGGIASMIGCAIAQLW